MKYLLTPQILGRFGMSVWYAPFEIENNQLSNLVQFGVATDSLREFLAFDVSQRANYPSHHYVASVYLTKISEELPQRTWLLLRPLRCYLLLKYWQVIENKDMDLM